MVDIPICINYGLWVDETIYLVGGFNPSEKKIVSWMMTFPTEWKVVKFMFQTTNQLW
jgi:hypothetical protein